MGETKLWYLVPLLFGLLGGIVSYIGLRDTDEGMGYLCLTFGAVVSFIEFVMALAVIM